MPVCSNHTSGGGRQELSGSDLSQNSVCSWCTHAPTPWRHWRSEGLSITVHSIPFRDVLTMFASFFSRPLSVTKVNDAGLFVGQTWGTMAAYIFQGVSESLLIRIPPSLWSMDSVSDSWLRSGNWGRYHDSFGALSCILLLTHLCCLSDSKGSACNARDLGFIPRWGRSSGEGNGNPLQYSCLENSMDRGAWQASVHGVTKSQTRLSYEHFHLY